MTKATALTNFRYYWKELTTHSPRWKGDVIAKRESWNNYTDSLCKDGEISMNQYESWSNPF